VQPVPEQPVPEQPVPEQPFAEQPVGEQLTLEHDWRHRRRAAARRTLNARLTRAVRALDHEQRIVGLAALGLIASMFTDWWRDPVLGSSHSAIDRLGFVELALVLVAASALLLLYRRGEGRVFHLPLSDSTLATLGGLWCCLLLVFRIFDRPTRNLAGRSIEYDLRWGVLLALVCSLALVYAGLRGRRRGRRV
jgi:hypothetical protein